MKNNMREYVQFLNRSKNTLFSLLIGGITGAALMLLFAPQSGKETRAFISEKGSNLLPNHKVDQFAYTVN